MTTQRQHASNQANARSSTGPKSPGAEGNARTHGLSASKCFSDEEQRMIDARLAEFEREHMPEGASQHDEVLAMATASVRLERCVAEEQTWRLRRAERAEFYWDADEQAEVMKLVQRLPKKADLIAPKLRQSLRGCIWMLEEWRDLAAHVRGTPDGEGPRPLDEVGRRRGFDLLGLSAERRVAFTPLDPPGGAGSAAAVAAHQGALIATQIATLEAFVSADLVALDESIRVDTMNGTNATIDDRTRLVRRYETEARRVKERASAKLKQLQDAAAALKKEARERERREWINTYLVPRPIPQDKIDQAKAQEALHPEPEPEPEPAAQAEAEPEAPAVPIEADQVIPRSVRSETFATVEEALRQTVDPTDPVVLPVTARRPLTRRARKILAARAAHREKR